MSAQNRNLHILGATSRATRKTLGSKEYLVVPVVALMEAVIHPVNAATPEFVPSEVLRASASTWNGRPLVVNHPSRNGVQISANSPEVIAAQGFGTIYNSRYENGKLLMDAYVDPVRLKELGQHELLDRIERGDVIEVSVGAYVNGQDEVSVYNGKSYKFKWNTAYGDHLAFLPKTRGACSVEMGCGAHRAAESHSLTHILTDTGLELETLGGPGSGNWGHAGRPGKRGGSAPRDESGGSSGSDSGNSSTTKGFSDPSRVPNQEEAKKIAKEFLAEANSYIGVEEDDNREPVSNLRHLPSDVRGIIKMTAAENIAFNMGDPEELAELAAEDPDFEDPIFAAERRIDLWAETSGDHDFEAVRMQMAVKEVFDLKDTSEDHFAAMRLPEPTLFDKKFVQSEYENTQHFLKEKGITHLTVYRGMTLPDDVAERVGEGGAHEISMQPASSWSLDPEHAISFAGFRQAFLLAARVPAERVLSTFLTGRGAAIEAEVILLGGRQEAQVIPLGDVQLHERLDYVEEQLKASAAKDTKKPVLKIDADLRNADWTKRSQDVKISGKRAKKPAAKTGRGDNMTKKSLMSRILSALRLVGAAQKDCEYCEGSGMVGKKECEHCAGTGQVKIAKEVETLARELRAADARKTLKEYERYLQSNNDRDDEDEDEDEENEDMTNEEKNKVIKELTSCECSGFTAADTKVLESMSVEQLAVLQRATESRKEALKAAQQAVENLTEEQVLAKFPSLKSLVDSAKAVEESKKTSLIESLKAAQNVYSEERLKAMSVSDLEDIAKLLNVDYSARGVPRAAASKDDVYLNPPSAYSEEALAAHRKSLGL